MQRTSYIPSRSFIQEAVDALDAGDLTRPVEIGRGVKIAALRIVGELCEHGGENGTRIMPDGRTLYCAAWL